MAEEMLFEADAARGYSVGLDRVPEALRSLRRRQLELCERLNGDDWEQPSRCHLWTVHDVLRHVRDACRIHVDGLRGGPSAFSPESPFSARDTPLRWLEETAGETPADTTAELSDLCAHEEVALEARLAQGGDDLKEGPYGPAHWTVLTTHVFWDGWLHDRDVTQALGRSHRCPAVEDGLMAMYSLLIASMPAALMEYGFDVTVGLDTNNSLAYAASVRPGRVVVEGGASEPVELRGDLTAVVDSLAGRGPELDAVLEGESSAREPLTWLRAILRPAA